LVSDLSLPLTSSPPLSLFLSLSIYLSSSPRLDTHLPPSLSDVVGLTKTSSQTLRFPTLQSPPTVPTSVDFTGKICCIMFQITEFLWI
jgi:hypothetical protein